MATPLGGTYSFLDQALHGARQCCSHPEPSVVEYVHSHLETVAFTPQHILCRDTDLIEVYSGSVTGPDAQLLVRGPAAEEDMSDGDIGDPPWNPFSPAYPYLVIPAPRSTINAVILSFISPVVGSGT